MFAMGQGQLRLLFSWTIEALIRSFLKTLRIFGNYIVMEHLI